MKFGQIIASSPGMFGDDVADEFRACLDTGPPVPFPDVRQRVEEDLGLPLRDAFAEFETEPIGTASIAVVHRARLLDGRTVAVKVLRPGHRARRGHRPRPHAAAARDPGAPDRRPDGRLHAAAARRLPGADRRGDGPAQRGALAGALPPAAERVRPEADGGARALPRALGSQRADDGVLRRRPHRRPGQGGRPRLRPHPAGAGGDAGLLPHHGALGRLPRRRARRQHDAAARRAHRRHRLGHRRAGSTPRRTASSFRCCPPPWATSRPGRW